MAIFAYASLLVTNESNGLEGYGGVLAGLDEITVGTVVTIFNMSMVILAA